MDQMVKAKLAEIAATAEVTRLKYERGQHWEGELSAECSRIAALAREVAEMVGRRGG